MKTIKKFASIMLAFVMCLCMAMPAMAASSSDTGTITVNGLENGVTVSAYQIAKATYDESTGQFLGYSMVVNAGSFSIGADGSYDESTLTEENLSALFDALGENPAATGSAVADADGTAVISNLPVGSYLLVVTGSQSTTYALMIGSVYYSTNGVENGSLSVVDGSAWAKSTTPQVTKTEAGGSLADDDFEHGGSANLGDELTYHITVYNIPAYYGDNPVFSVTDTISDELTISDDQLAALKITTSTGATLAYGTAYTVTRASDGSNGFVVDFVVDGSYTLNAYAGGSLLIEYKATVSAATTDGADDHTNDVVLSYTTNSYAEGQDQSAEDHDHDYTFSVKATKVDENAEPLSGATFALYTDEACTNEYKQNGSAVTSSTDSNGTIIFSGLQTGTYYMKETVAPNGYTLNTTVFKVVIEATIDNSNGDLSSWSITITDLAGNPVGSAISTSTTDAAIPNTQVSSLPSTGGMGTTLFTIGGCILMLAAVALVVVMRRRSTNAQ